MNRSAFAFFVLVGITPCFVGCANDDASSPDVAAGEQQFSTSADQSLREKIAAAIVNLETGGGEGDPDPYKLAEIELAPGEEMTNELLLVRLLPKMIEPFDDYVPGLEEYPVEQMWASYTAEPNPADYDDPEELDTDRQKAASWREVQRLFESELMNVKYFDMGYSSSPGWSLETGEVAHVFVGQSVRTGRIFAVWGIDVWT